MATVRPATGTRPVLSITRDIRRLGAGTRPGMRSGRRQVTSGRAKAATARASAATGRLVTAIRIGTGPAPATGQVTGTGLTLVTARRTTATSLATGTGLGLLPAGKLRHLATAPDTVRTATVAEVMTSTLDTDLTAIGTVVTDQDQDQRLALVLAPASTVRRPATGVTVVGIRRHQPTGTGLRLAATTTGRPLSTEATAIRGVRVTIRVVTKVNTGKGRAMVEVGRVGLGLTAGCRRAGRIGGGLATRGLPGLTTGPATR